LTRFLPLLLEAASLRAWRERLLLGMATLGLALIGVVYLLSAGMEALTQSLGVLKADLIFGFGFLLLALLCWGITRYRWRRRPRPAQVGALLAVFGEGLALVRSLMRRDPVTLALLAILLGTLRSILQKDKTPSD
jgi:drug/metabolite transporter (DMT)-like permease